MAALAKTCLKSFLLAGAALCVLLGGCKSSTDTSRRKAAPAAKSEQHVDDNKTGSGQPSAPRVLGFAFGMTRAELEREARHGFELTPGTHASLLQGRGKAGQSGLEITWTFDEGSHLVEMSARPIDAPAPDVSLEQTALFAKLKKTLGAPDKARREGSSETASWRRGDAVVVVGAIVSVSKGSGKKHISLSMDAWSDEHRKAREAIIKKSLEADTAEKLREAK